MKNEKYSHKNFTDQILTHTDPSEWDDTDVIGTCFYNQKPLTEVFPSEIKNVKFIGCNLDNIIIPDGCTIEGGCHRLIQVQNDGEDWLIDKDLNPIEPLNKTQFEKLGLSIDPKDISGTKVNVPLTITKYEQLAISLETQKAALDEAAKSWGR
jgi:hypothetical protein